MKIISIGLFTLWLCNSSTILVNGAFVVGTSKIHHDVSSSSLSLLPFHRPTTTKNNNNNGFRPLFYQEEPKESTAVTSSIPTTITNPVLQQLYPSLIEYKQTYGHPNIPLGSKEGKQCIVLRRLHIQNKLSEDEIQLLDSIGFIWNSLEDVYFDVDFNVLLKRLLDYEQRHPNNNFQVPKKCKEDPELGAWVTGLRRLYKTYNDSEKNDEQKRTLDPQHIEKLNNVGFAWVSTRKCGSKFMEQYRLIVKRLETNSLQDLLSDSKVQDWVHAQQKVNLKGNLSNTRKTYMEDIFGLHWMEL